MFSRYTALALAIGLAAPAFAQKAAPVSPLELGADPVEAVSADGLTYVRTARPALLTALDAPVAAAAPDVQARSFLAGYASQLGLQRADLSDLETTLVRRSAAGTVVRLRQTVGGVPVWGSESVVNIDAQDRVQLVANAYRSSVGSLDVQPSVDAAAARAAFYSHLGVTDAPAFETQELIVWPSSPARLAWAFEVETAVAPGAWQGIVDAHTGELVRAANRAVYHGPDDERRTGLPLAELSPNFRADGTGMIFDPDPNTRAGVPRNTPGYSDSGDADSPELTAARVMRTLPNLEVQGSTYFLKNEWSEVQDWEPSGPNYGVFSQDSPDFDFTRNDNAFEAVTTFWHIDNMMRYVNETLDVDARPQVYSTGVRFDPHGLGGADNSYYTGGSQRLAFGEGCVDDAEDADVIIHELGHGLHDWVSNRNLSNGEGLSEGFGDYIANSYTRSLGLLAPNDQAYNRVFRWDGWYSGCWGGRTTDYTANYPTGGVPHQRGQHWSTSNLRVWDVIGGQRTDKAVLEGLAMTTSNTTQPQAAQAVLQAAANMGYSEAEVTAFFDSYVDQGYNVTFPVSNEDVAAAELAGVLLTAPAPNPFNGLTTFEVMVDAPQAVTVEVFDAVGRRVATLFDGEMTAGKRFPIALDAEALRSGVYVVRVTGESISTSRRVTVVR